MAQDSSNVQHRKWLPQLKMGYVDTFTGKTFLYNHFDLHLQYQTHPTDASTKYIVGFEVYPSAYVVENTGRVAWPLRIL